MSQGILWAVPSIPNTVLDYVAPIHPVGTHRHITLQYGVEFNHWSNWIGFQFWATIVAECWNNRVHALAVTIPGTIPFGLTISHITISRVSEAAPVESTGMMQTAHSFTELSELVPMKIEFNLWEN